MKFLKRGFLHDSKRADKLLHLFPFDFFGMNRVQLQPLQSFCDPMQIAGIGVGDVENESREWRVRSGGRIRGRDGGLVWCRERREETKEMKEQRIQRGFGEMDKKDKVLGREKEEEEEEAVCLVEP